MRCILSVVIMNEVQTTKQSVLCGVYSRILLRTTVPQRRERQRYRKLPLNNKVFQLFTIPIRRSADIWASFVCCGNNLFLQLCVISIYAKLRTIIKLCWKYFILSDLLLYSVL